MPDDNKSQPDKVSFTEAEIKFIKKLDEQRIRVENRFPLITALLVTFGFVSVLYGFEKMIDRIDFFVERPYVLLAVGATILIITGAFYKKLN